jgi:hypothetical protein
LCEQQITKPKRSKAEQKPTSGHAWLCIWEKGEKVVRAKGVKLGKRTMFTFTFRLPNSSRAECSQAWFEQPLCANVLNLFIMWAFNIGKAGPSQTKGAAFFLKIWKPVSPAAAKMHIKLLGSAFGRSVEEAWSLDFHNAHRVLRRTCQRHTHLSCSNHFTS